MILIVAASEHDFADWKLFNPGLAKEARHVRSIDDMKGLRQSCPIVYFRRWYNLADAYEISDRAKQLGCGEL